MHYKLPLFFDPQPEGGYTVTCPSIPELITEGDNVEDALENIRDALAAVLEIYLGSSLAYSVGCIFFFWAFDPRGCLCPPEKVGIANL